MRGALTAAAGWGQRVTIRELTWEQKVLLAGALRRVIVADGVIVDAEIEWVDILRDEERFDELDQCLEAFASRVSSDEDMWKMAEAITDSTVQQLIYDQLATVAERDGSLHRAEEDLLIQLRQIWSVAK